MSGNVQIIAAKSISPPLKAQTLALPKAKVSFFPVVFRPSIEKKPKNNLILVKQDKECSLLEQCHLCKCFIPTGMDMILHLGKHKLDEIGDDYVVIDSRPEVNRDMNRKVKSKILAAQLSTRDTRRKTSLLKSSHKKLEKKTTTRPRWTIFSPNS